MSLHIEHYAAAKRFTRHTAARTASDKRDIVLFGVFHNYGDILSVFGCRYAQWDNLVDTRVGTVSGAVKNIAEYVCSADSGQLICNLFGIFSGRHRWLLKITG
jgi:hypothetical protein